MPNNDLSQFSDEQLKQELEKRSLAKTQRPQPLEVNAEEDFDTEEDVDFCPKCDGDGWNYVGDDDEIIDCPDCGGTGS